MLPQPPAKSQPQYSKTKYTQPPLEFQQGIQTILRNQQVKKWIQSLLIKPSPTAKTPHRIPLPSILFQVYKESILTDHNHTFNCLYELTQKEDVRNFVGHVETRPRKTGAVIRTIRMDFDLRLNCLVIYEFEYLGGQNTIVEETFCQPANWNQDNIRQIIRKNSMVNGGQILFESMANTCKMTSQQQNHNTTNTQQRFQTPLLQYSTPNGISNFFASLRQKSSQIQNLKKLSFPQQSNHDKQIMQDQMF